MRAVASLTVGFGEREIVVAEGKRLKDRVTVLPRTLASPLAS